MPKVKYCVTEFTPTANQVGMSHSFNAKVAATATIHQAGSWRDSPTTDFTDLTDLYPKRLF